MCDWRTIRVARMHVLSWAVLVAGMGISLLAQTNSENSGDWSGWRRGYSEYGWPLLALTRTDELPGFFSGSIPRATKFTNRWNWPGVLSNAIVFAAFVASSTFVCEYLIRNWRNPWQFSLAGVLWMSSAIAVVLAAIWQEYPPPVSAAFQYLNLVPRSERDINLWIRTPIYVGIGCSFFVFANGFLCLAHRLWQLGPRAKPKRVTCS